MKTSPVVLAFSVTGMLLALAFPASADTASELMAQGDVFDLQFQPAKALARYIPAEKLTPDDPALLLRIARQYRHLMSDTSAKKEKLGFGRTALEYAQRAAALAPKDSEAQLSPAISYGKMLPFMSSGDQVDAAPRIKASVDRSLRLDPKNDNAWHILGRWNRVLADISGVKRALAGVIFGKLPATTNEAAEACLKKAIALNPNRLMHYVELGRVYVQMGRIEDAKKFLKKGLSMPKREHDDKETLAVARETLNKLP